MKIVDSPAYHSLTQALVAACNSTSLFIYDNSLGGQEFPQSLAWSTEYFHDPSNPGVSRAYNEGFRYAKKTNKKWMLLADQDTVFPQNCFDAYFKAVMELRPSIIVPTLKDNIGIASPLKFYLGGGQRVRDFENESFLKLKDFFFHNSGLLIATEAFEKAGGYDERLRLDFSDFAFVQRLRHRYQEFVIANFCCSHRLATTESIPSEERLNRFESYVSSGRYFKKRYGNSERLLLLRIFLRGLKLSLKYGTIKFMTPIFRRS